MITWSGVVSANKSPVLYYDLVQSVTLSNLIGDPEVFLEIVRSIHARFDVLLSRLGGTKYQTEGDGAWYLFGWPAIEGNQAAHSAHAALAIMQAARELKLPVPAGWVVQFRVTVASDLMVIMPTERESEVDGSGERHTSRSSPEAQLPTRLDRY